MLSTTNFLVANITQTPHNVKYEYLLTKITRCGIIGRRLNG